MTVRRLILLVPALIILVLILIACSGPTSDEGGELLPGLPPYFRAVALALDKDNVLWMGSLGAVAYYDNEFRIFDRLNTRIPDIRITEVFIDSDNTLWFGTEKGYVYTFNGSEWQVLPTPEGSYKDSLTGTYVVRDILEDNNGNIWATAVNGGIWNYKDKEIDRHYSFPRGKYHDHSLSIDTEGNLYALISEELYEFNGEDWEIVTPEILDMENCRISCVLYDNVDGRAYYGTNKGIYVLGGGDVILHNVKNSGLASDRIQNMEMDKQGNIWIAYGSSSRVLTMFDGVNWTDYEGRGGFIWDVAHDETGNMWFIATSNGLFIFNGHNWSSLPVLNNDPRLWWRQKSLSELSQEDTHDVDIHAVLDNPWDYRDKKIKFTGKLSTGFESASIVDEQGTRTSIWPTYHNEIQSGDIDDVLQMKSDPEHPEMSESVYVEFIGYLEYQGYYGHMNAWSYQLFIMDILPLG